MMQPLRRFSEPFAATGNMHGKGFQRLLGRPALSLVQTVIREALQNCVDASLPGTPINVLIRSRALSPEENAFVRDVVFADLPPAETSRKIIAQTLGKQHLRVLEISDFNTVGLAGPTRADLAVGYDEPRNFVNFLRNVGAGRDVHLGGGTYGYGKTSLYALSSCATILTDSLTTWQGQSTRRVMACHLGEAFDDKDETNTLRRFTGRHWWGGVMQEGNLEPAEGSHAEGIANGIGLPPRPTGRTGTTIMIIDPMFDSDIADDIGDELVEAVLWNFWPRMAESTPPEKRLNVQLEVEGQHVPIPKPEKFPPLDLFSKALQRLRSNDGITGIRCESPKKVLGRLVICDGLTADRNGPALRSGSSIPSQAAHIALMRPVELVVTYLRGDPFPDPRFEWAGVFICSDEDDVEAAFAEAEPPAHDDWIPSNLPKGRTRTYVTVALKRLTEHAKRVSGARSPQPDPSDGGPSLAATASKLGRLLTTSSSRGSARSPKPGHMPARREAGIAVQRPLFRGLEAGPEGQPIAIFEAELKNDGSQANLIVVVEPHLVADGAKADADDLPPEYQVRLVRLELPSASLVTSGHALKVGTHSGTLRIAVQTPANAAAGVKATLRLDERS